jgi:hypothetical protein
MTTRPRRRSRRSARSHATDSRSGARRYDATCARRRESLSWTSARGPVRSPLPSATGST